MEWGYNIRHPRYFVFANTSMLLFWKYYTITERKCLRKRNNLDSLCYFHSINVQFLLSKRYRRKLKFLISTFDRIYGASPDHISICLKTIPRVSQLCYTSIYRKFYVRTSKATVYPEVVYDGRKSGEFSSRWKPPPKTGPYLVEPW